MFGKKKKEQLEEQRYEKLGREAAMLFETLNNASTLQENRSSKISPYRILKSELKTIPAIDVRNFVDRGDFKNINADEIYDANSRNTPILASGFKLSKTVAKSELNTILQQGKLTVEEMENYMPTDIGFRGRQQTIKITDPITHRQGTAVIASHQLLDELGLSIELSPHALFFSHTNENEINVYEYNPDNIVPFDTKYNSTEYINEATDFFVDVKEEAFLSSSLNNYELDVPNKYENIQTLKYHITIEEQTTGYQERVRYNEIIEKYALTYKENPNWTEKEKARAKKEFQKMCQERRQAEQMAWFNIGGTNDNFGSSEEFFKWYANYVQTHYQPNELYQKIHGKN